MNLKNLLIVVIVALSTTMLTLWYTNSNNKQLIQENELKTRIIDSLLGENNSKEYQLQKYEIFLEELDDTSLFIIDSILRNIE